MTRSLSEQILQVLGERAGNGRPTSLAALARTFGVSVALVNSCAQQLVASGSAEASMASHRGQSSIQGLSIARPQPAG